MTVHNTLEQRGNRYGEIDDNAFVTQELMRVINSSPNAGKLTDVHRECLHMICHKIARMCCGDLMYADNPHDIAGYATLLEEYIINTVGDQNV
jgi:hypothetical protein